jgi:Domain of unknown function (DUF4386)
MEGAGRGERSGSSAPCSLIQLLSAFVGGNEMIVSTINESQRKAARVAGFTYLFTFAIVVYVNFGIHDRLIVAGNPAETARNIIAQERLFRVGIAGDLTYCVGVVVLLSALRDSRAGQSGPCIVRGVLEARRGLDVARYDAPRLRLSVVQVPLYPSSTGCLRRALVYMVRGVHFRFLHFPQLRQSG